MNIRKVLVPVDFSPASQFAVDFAVSFTRKFQAQLTLLHVTEKETSGKQRAEEAVGRLSAMLSPEDQDDLDLQIRIRIGSIETEIRSCIDDEHADIVVLGTHHRGLIRRLLIGSVTEDLLRKLPVPVLTISGEAQPKPLSRILYATDLSESSNEGFTFALELAQAAGASLTVLHSIEPLPLFYGGSSPVMDIEEEKKPLIEEARRKMTELQAEGARKQVVVVTEVTEGFAAERILAAAVDSDAELIVLTIRDKGIVERTLLGSTAERVVRDAPVPVLSIPVRVETNRVEITDIQGVPLPDRSAMP
jgi:nucleotide-binding universal stress UspA family protein